MQPMDIYRIITATYYPNEFNERNHFASDHEFFILLGSSMGA